MPSKNINLSVLYGCNHIKQYLENCTSDILIFVAILYDKLNGIIRKNHFDLLNSSDLDRSGSLKI